MANYKDNNSDLGNQTIEGTVSPYALDAEFEVQEAAIVTPSSDDSLDEQLAVLMAEPDEKRSDLDKQLDEILGMQQQQKPDSLDEQLAVLMAEPDEKRSDLDKQLDEILGMQQQQKSDSLDEQLAVLMAEPADVQSDGNDPLEDILKDIQADADRSADELLDKLINEDINDDTVSAEQPVIIAVPPNTENGAASTEPNDTNGAADVINDRSDPVDEPVIIQTQDSRTDSAANETAETTAEQKQTTSSDEATEAARMMMQQAKLLMEQAQQAQAQVNAQIQAAQIQAQAQQAVQAAQINAQARSADQNDDTSLAEARAIMQQAKLLTEQAQQAQLQAQQAAQAAQMQAQALQEATRTAAPTSVAVDPYAVKEVDRLKGELDSMRDLVNKLTFTLAQSPNSAQQAVQLQSHGGYSPELEQYRKLESELERMRREILEKDLRDREKELDRRQKEAENSVKDIRPEMVQMSDSRDIAPVSTQAANVGGEYIPLANGVYYSTKDKQVYVMTLASGAASARPTIEKPRTAPARKKPAAHAARPGRRTAARRRPGSPLHRRHPRGGRPTHR